MAPSIQEIYEAAREYIGFADRQDLGVITEQHLQRFAVACGDLNPIHLDDAAARAAGYPGVVAPPVFLTAVLGWGPGPFEAELRPDGTTPGDVVFIPLPGLRLMGGGQDLEFMRPVVAGARVSVRRTVTDVRLQEGRSGPLLLLTIEKRFYDQCDELLTVCRETFIGR